MRKYAIIILSITVGVLIIGIHQVMVNGFTNSYWIFMFVIIGLLGYQYITKHTPAPPEEKETEKDADSSVKNANSPTARTRKKIKKLSS